MSTNESARTIVGKLSPNARQLVLHQQIVVDRKEALRLRSEFKRHILGGVFIDPLPRYDPRRSPEIKQCKWFAGPDLLSIAVREQVLAANAKDTGVHRVGTRVFKL